MTYDGNITLGCCTPFKETYSYGNLLEQPFSEVWNNEFFRKNREMAKRGVAPTQTCASCDSFSKAFFQTAGGDSAGFVPLGSLAATIQR